VEAWGHPNVRAAHPTTFEVTREDRLTGRGDCVIAVRASVGARDLSEDFKAIARTDGSRILVSLQAAGVVERVEGRGDSRLSFRDPTSFVVRRSDFACGRTLMLRTDKAARDLSRELVHLLQNPGQRVSLTLTASLSGSSCLGRSATRVGR
jgi:hypothetical protein